jgi:hypothetical protein
MPKALKRGIAHYQGGSESVSPDDATFVADRAANYNAGRGVTPVAPAAPAIPGTLSRIGSLFTGDYGKVATDPNASPFMSWLAGINQTADINTRARNLSHAPALGEKAYVGLFGNQATDWPELQQREATAQVIGHPLAQKYLRENPAALAVAERDPATFAVDFGNTLKAELQRAVTNNAATAANPKVATADEHKVTVDKANNTGVHPDVAHVAVAPHKYTEDEFVNTFKNIPTSTFMQLFGNQLGHVRTPQEKASTELFDRLHGAYADANAKVKKMAEEDAAAKDAGKPAIHDRYVLWGKNAFDQAKEERDKAMNATMEALKSFTGISQKGFVVP